MNLLSLKEINKKFRGMFYLEKMNTLYLKDKYIKPGTMSFQFIARENIIAKISHLSDENKNQVIYVNKIQGHCMGDTLYGVTAEGYEVISDSFALVPASIIETLIFLFKTRKSKLIKDE